MKSSINQQMFLVETHEVEITNAENFFDEEGNLITQVTGTLDGHDIAMIDDGTGSLAEGAIDLNDNGVFEEDEIVDLSGTGKDIFEATGVEFTDTIDVVAANVDGESFLAIDADQDGVADMAYTTINGEDVIIVDGDHDGEADMAFMDLNGDGYIDETEGIILTDSIVDDICDDVVMS